MSILKLKYANKQFISKEDGKKLYNDTLSEAEFKKFNLNSLGMGDVSIEGKSISTIAAIFDLSGFTDFCNQIDEHLVVPEYLSLFLEWLFNEIKNESVREMTKGDYYLFNQLPFYSKFLGDGVLFLWDTKDLHLTSIGNIFILLTAVINSYKNKFLPANENKFSKMPNMLRCGASRGDVISIGDGSDFVGPCINVASRLQKLSTLSFAFSKRGININKCFTKAAVDSFVTKKVNIRGIGDDEIVIIDKKDFDELPKEEKNNFS